VSRSPGAVAHHRHHRHPLRRIYGVGLLLLLVVLLGWAGFRYTTGFSWFNSLYLTVSVLSTNGYTGELGDLTPHTKMLSMVLIVLGGGVFVYSITQITTVLMDEETRRYFGLQTQLRKVRRMENHMIVCGLGRVGVAVCQEFAKNGQEFLLVERDPGRLEKAAGNGWATMPGDATEDRTLEQAGIAKARGLVACVESDAANLFIVISARGLNDHMEIF
jgi:voltage-gated potassium channel